MAVWRDGHRRHGAVAPGGGCCILAKNMAHVPEIGAASPATWQVYLLRCADGTFYTGITTDLARRLGEHNGGAAGARYTRARRPVVLAWSEPAADRAAASRREYVVRRLPRAAKERLAGATAPDHGQT